MTTFRLSRFEKALHPDVKRGEAGVAWIKSYTGQLDDPDYALLSIAERGLLQDLRLLAARRNNELPLDLKRLRILLRYDEKSSRLAARFDRLAELRFVERSDAAAWMPLWCPRTPAVRPSTPGQAETLSNVHPLKRVETLTTEGSVQADSLPDLRPDKSRPEQTLQPTSVVDVAGDWNGHKPPSAVELAEHFVPGLSRTDVVVSEFMERLRDRRTG